MRIRSTVALVGAATLLAACATTPTGPAVTVMPGNGKTFEASRAAVEYGKTVDFEILQDFAF